MRIKIRRAKAFAQKLYLCVELFIQNDLLTYAAAGAYSFLLSFIPVIMLILMVLLRVLNTSADLLSQVLTLGPVLNDTFEFKRLIDSVNSLGKAGFLELLLGISIFWMARRFFYSIMQGMRKIFHDREQLMPFFSAIWAIIGEVLLITICSVIIFAGTLIQTVFPVLQPKQARFLALFSTIEKIFAFSPVFILLLFIALVYHYIPRNRPKWLVCIISAVCCTAIFAVVVFFFRIFLNAAAYNLLYGVLGNLIILLLEVFIFFALFLFFAQLMFVSQFFDLLLLGQLYLLPPHNTRRLEERLRRKLFLHPPLRAGIRRGCYKKGELVFNAGEKSNDVFYVINGRFESKQENKTAVILPGMFFGETDSLLALERTETVQAAETARVLRINRETFIALLDANPEVNRRVTIGISDFFAEQRINPDAQ